jgi:hypothetical protein
VGPEFDEMVRRHMNEMRRRSFLQNLVSLVQVVVMFLLMILFIAMVLTSAFAPPRD